MVEFDKKSLLTHHVSAKGSTLFHEEQQLSHIHVFNHK